MAEKGANGRFVSGGGKTVSEPTAIPAEPQEVKVQTLLMDREKYDYCLVEPRPIGWTGQWQGPDEKRKAGYGTVPVQRRDDEAVDLLYPEREMMDSVGRRFVDPEQRETLHPGLILMARKKELGDAARAKEERENNPQLIDDDSVPKNLLRNPNGVMTRVNQAVNLTNLGERLPTAKELRSRKNYEERVEKRGQVDENYSKELENAATDTVRIAD